MLQCAMLVTLHFTPLAIVVKLDSGLLDTSLTLHAMSRAYGIWTASECAVLVAPTTDINMSRIVGLRKKLYFFLRAAICAAIESLSCEIPQNTPFIRHRRCRHHRPTAFHGVALLEVLPASRAPKINAHSVGEPVSAAMPAGSTSHMVCRWT